MGEDMSEFKKGEAVHLQANITVIHWTKAKRIKQAHR